MPAAAASACSNRHRPRMTRSPTMPPPGRSSPPGSSAASTWPHWFTSSVLAQAMATGTLHLVNAGHPVPLLIRDGTTEPVTLPANRPFGGAALQALSGCGDQVAAWRPPRAADRRHAGTRRRRPGPVQPATTPERTTPRRGRTRPRRPGPPDDACLLILDWHGGHGTTRHTAAGAEPRRASKPTADEKRT